MISNSKVPPANQKPKLKLLGDSMVRNMGNKISTNDVQDSSKSELVELYKSLIDTIKRVAPKAKHIICAVPHRLGAENVELNKKIDYLNDKLQYICAEDPGLNFVNFNPELSVRNYNNDSLHFSLYGRSFFANCLCNYISQS